MSNSNPSPQKADKKASKVAVEVEKGIVQMPKTESPKPVARNPAIEHSLEVVEGEGVHTMTDPGVVQGTPGYEREAEEKAVENNGQNLTVVTY